MQTDRTLFLQPAFSSFVRQKGNQQVYANNDFTTRNTGFCWISSGLYLRGYPAGVVGVSGVMSDMPHQTRGAYRVHQHMDRADDRLICSSAFQIRTQADTLNTVLMILREAQY